MKHDFSSVVFAHYYYFSDIDDENLKKLWEGLKSACGLDSAVAEAQVGFSRTVPRKAKFHFIQALKGKDRSLYLFRSQNVFIVEVVLSKEGGRITLDVLGDGVAEIQEFKSGLDRITEGAFGQAAVLLAEKIPDNLAGARDELVLLGEWLRHCEPLRSDFWSGTLLHFYDGFKHDCDYYLYAPADQAGTGSFLLEDLPLIDVSIQKAKLEGGYFLEQSRSIEKERKETDKSIDSILHRGIIASKEDGKRIEFLQDQVRDLSRLYGLVAEQGMITKAAFHQLKRDVEFIRQQVAARIVPDSSHKGLQSEVLNDFESMLGQLKTECDLLDYSLGNARAALDVVGSRVDLEQSNQSLTVQDQTRKLLDQNIVLQKEGISLQVAAIFIEFVVVFYYSLHSWETLARAEAFDKIPALVQFGIILAFSTSVIICTHFAAKKIEKPNEKNIGFLLSLLAILLSLASIFGATILLGH